MDKCPKCEHWTLSFNPFKGVVQCHNCNYKKNVDTEKHLEKYDLMPKLSKSLSLNGYTTGKLKKTV